MVQSDPERLVHLAVKSGPDAGRMFFLKAKKEALIGRGPLCDLRLTDPGCSQKHCMVRSAGDIVFIEDLQSRNGTRVNGEPTTDRVLDENGLIEIGTSVIELTWVATEKTVPVHAVESPGAPTLMERPHVGDTGRLVNRETKRIPSTMLTETQMKEFRAARGRLGQMIGDYLLLETLGTWDLGAIFRAKGLKSKEEVALTIIPNDTAVTVDLLKIFIEGTKTGVEAPNTVRIQKAGMTENEGYIITDVVKGRDLESALDAGRKFTPAQAVEVLLPVCEALAWAHAESVIHGELRPESILITAEEKSLLQGLGLPSRTDPEGKTIFKRKERLSALAFLAPELTLAKKAAPASDVYSLGAVLYTTLTGKRPYEAKSKLELVRAIRWEDPAPLANVAKPLVDAVATAMAKESDKRFPGMREFAEALKAAVK